MSIPLGGFSFEVSASIGSAQQALQQLVQNAQQSARSVQAAFQAASVQVNTQQAQQQIAQVSQRVQRLQQGATITVTANTQQAQQSIAALGQIAQGALRGTIAGSGIGGNLLIGAGVGAGAAGALAAAVAFQKLTETIVGGIKAGVEYNATLEQTTKQLVLLTGSANQAEVLIGKLRQFADVTPFGTKETLEVGQRFATILNGNIELTERYVHLAGQLAATSPDKTLGDAARAIEEFKGGQVQTLADVFNVPRSQIEAIKALGLSTEETLQRIIALRGGSEELVKSLGETFTGRLSTAESTLRELGRVASQPLFDVLARSVKEFNDSFEQNKAGWQQAAQGIGSAIGSIADESIKATKDIAAFVVESEKLFVFADKLAHGVSPQQAREAAQAPAAPARQLTPAEQALQDRGKAQSAEVDRITNALGQEQRKLEDIQRANQAISAIVSEITQKYDQQKAPLEANLRAIQDQKAAAEARVAAANEEIRQAQAPVQDRAQVAGAQVLIDHERELIQIRQQRRQVFQDIADAEAAVAANAAQRQIQAEREVLEALQREIQLRQEARRVAIEGLQEEIRQRQEARQIALEALRSEIQAQQEARREVLDGLREEIQGRQEARRAAIDGLREEIDTRRRGVDEERQARQDARQDIQDAFQEQERLADRAHTAVMERYQAQIEALQAQLNIRHQQSAAELELAAFNQAETARQRAQTIAGAETAVARARTGAERRDALERLAEIRAQAAADAKREEIQARIDKEHEAEQKRQEAIQANISVLEAKARDEDRRYQREKDARDEAFRLQQRAQDLQDRADERAERARRATEDAQVRAAEKADREQTKRDEAEVRAAEKADREQAKAEQAAIAAAEASARAADRADQAKLRAAEQADRAQTRQEDAQIRAQQAGIQSAENRQREISEQRQAQADRQRLSDLREVAGLTLTELANRERITRETDAQREAAATAARVIAQSQVESLTAVETIITRALDAINRAAAEAVAPYTLIRDRLQEMEGFVALAVSDFKIQKQMAEDVGKAIRAQADAMRIVAEQAERAAQAQAQAAQASPAGPRPAIIPGDIPGDFGAVGPGAELGRWLRGKFDEWLSGIERTMQEKFGDPALNQQLQQDAARIGQEAANTFGNAVASGLDTFFGATPAFAEELDQNFGDVVDGANIGATVAGHVTSSMTESQSQIEAALAAPFTAFFAAGGPADQIPVQFAQLALNAADYFGTAWTDYHLDQVILDDIERIILAIEARQTAFREPGRRAGLTFEEGFCAGIAGMRDCFARQMEWMIANARPYGTQVGAQFSSGFAATAGQGGSTGGGTPTGGGGGTVRPTLGTGVINDAVRDGRHQTRNGPRWIEVYINGYWYESGFASPNFHPGTGGGGVQSANLQGVESVMPTLRAAGAVLPASLGVGNAATAARAPVVAGVVQTNSGDFNLTVNQTVQSQPGHDPSQIAQMSVAMLIDAIDKAERAAPPLVRRTLPGAIGNRV